jgi:hypothetical protein
VLAEQSDPFTVMGTTLLAGAELPPVTVRMAEPVVFPDLAMIIVVFVVAVETAVAKPLLFSVATSGADDVQVTDAMRSVVELLE